MSAQVPVYVAVRRASGGTEYVVGFTDGEGHFVAYESGSTAAEAETEAARYSRVAPNWAGVNPVVRTCTTEDAAAFNLLPANQQFAEVDRV